MNYLNNRAKSLTNMLKFYFFMYTIIKKKKNYVRNIHYEI